METVAPNRRPSSRRLLLAVCVLALLALVFFTLLSSGASSTGRLQTASGAHEIVVELASTEREREVGLMNRDSMPADQGMLFDFKETRLITMWMKNTYIPLDMVFMDESGRVTHVAANAQPLSLDIISSREPARYVLELNGGTAARYGLKAGDRLEHPVIPNSQ
jgi:uncharacterized membrane protein (UPF0127 family)